MCANIVISDCPQNFRYMKYLSTRVCEKTEKLFMRRKELAMETLFVSSTLKPFVVFSNKFSEIFQATYLTGHM